MHDTVDLLVVGGGVNGLAIAADASGRGLSVALVERDDIAAGTSAASSRLIHGGLRYLQFGEFGLVRESLRERGLLARRRPHLVRPIDLVIPIYQGRKPAGWHVGAGLALYHLLARDPLFSAPKHLSRDDTIAREPGLDPAGLRGSFVYPDAQIAFPERLAVALRAEALAAGATVQTHTAVVRLLRDSERVTGALVRDTLTQEISEVRARLTVNAAGPWVDAVNATLERPPARRIGGTWGTHLVLPRRDGGPAGFLYAVARTDSRPFFLLPWDGALMVGTTDVKLGDAEPDTVTVQPWEIAYLLAETNALFPEARYTEADIQATTVGVRPLPASDRRAAAVTRRHFLVDHAATDGVPGLASIVGGKLTTCRSLAEHAVDTVLHLLGTGPIPCLTARTDDAPDTSALTDAALRALQPHGVSDEAVARLVALYGPELPALLGRISADPSLALPLAPGSTDLRAQAAHAVDAEGARTPEDILRRRLVRLAPTDAEVAAAEAFLPG